MRLAHECYLYCQATAPTHRTDNRRECLFKMAASRTEVAWQTHQPLSAHLSAQRTERENTKGRFNWTWGAKKTRRDGMAGRKKKRGEKGSRVLWSQAGLFMMSKLVFPSAVEEAVEVRHANHAQTTRSTVTSCVEFVQMSRAMFKDKTAVLFWNC